MSMRIANGIAVVAVCAAVAACSKGENKAASAAAADSAAKATAAATPSPAATPPLNDANILALMDVVNAADSGAGSIAATKGTHADVKEFGRTMMRDHHALRKSGEDLAKKLSLTPAPPAGDTSQVATQHWQDNLTSMPPGDAWDKAYIDHEVTYHQAVLQCLQMPTCQTPQTSQTLTGTAQDSSLKAVIVKAIAMVQAHLAKAQSIQTQLNAAKP